MRSPIAPPYPDALAPVAPKSDTPRSGLTARQGASRFAELLAAAEAVRDRVEIRQAAPASRGVAGVLKEAVGLLARRTPWMGPWALEKRPRRT